MRKRVFILVAAITLVFSGQVSAALGRGIEVNGFMSTGTSWTDDSKVIYNSGITNIPSSDKLTVFGLNFSGNMADRLTFNAITVIRGREANPTMRLDTGNISYQISDTWTLRAGKLRAPIWLISDYLDVKAVQPWARPPEEFYEAPFDVFTFDGLSLIKTIPVGRNHIELEAFGGSGKIAVKEKRIEIDGDIRDFVGISGRYYGRNWQIKGSWSRADIKNHTYWDLTPANTTAYGDPVQNRQAQTIAPSPFDTSNMQFTSLGVQYDGYFFLWAEYGRLTAGRSRSESVPDWDTKVPSIPVTFAECNSYYVTPGYYFQNRNYLVHFTYALVDDKKFIGIIDGAHHSYTLGLNRYFGNSVVVKGDWGQSSPVDYKSGKDGLFNSVKITRPVNFYDVSLNLTF